MSKAKKQKIYVVIRGRRCGLFDSWNQCEGYVKNYSGNIYEAFHNLDDAIEYFLVNQFAWNNVTLHYEVGDVDFCAESREEFVDYLVDKSDIWKELRDEWR